MSGAVTHLLVVIAAAVVGRASAGEETARICSPATIIVIKYCLEPPGTFKIVGTNIEGIKNLSGLTKALRKHKARNPSAKYEIVSEVKCPPDAARDIVKAVAKAGIKLEHFWAVRSSLAPGAPVGPYGVGYVDVIERYQNAR